jgi:hypothetical protein
MRYLRKTPASKILAAGWIYNDQDSRENRKIRDELLREQHQFCAYSEKYVQPTESCDVEHFDPRLKHTPQDDYWNWYAVLHWMNNHKPRIDRFLPLPAPHSPNLFERIRYEDGQFLAIDEADREADNLIRFLGWNRPELARERNNHVSRIRALRDAFLEGDEREFLAYLSEHPQELSFATALQAELGIDISDIIASPRGEIWG